MVEVAKTFNRLMTNVTTVACGVALKGILRVHQGFREDLRSGIVGRALRYGKLDDTLSVAELGLLPKDSRDQALQQIDRAVTFRREIYG